MTDAPIIPVGLIGTQHAQPIGTRFPLPFKGRITVEFGEPIYPTDYRYGGGRKRRQHILADVMNSIAAMTDQSTADDFDVHRNVTMAGGSEAVYRITRHGATGLTWRHAAERAVDHGSRRYDDGRVAEVKKLRCVIGADGDVVFETQISMSSRVRSDRSAKEAP